jgi:hypothetical protein
MDRSVIVDMSEGERGGERGRRDRTEKRMVCSLRVRAGSVEEDIESERASRVGLREILLWETS